MEIEIEGIPYEDFYKTRAVIRKLTEEKTIEKIPTKYQPYTKPKTSQPIYVNGKRI